MKALQAVYEFVPGARLAALFYTDLVHREEGVVICAQSCSDRRTLICHLTILPNERQPEREIADLRTEPAALR